MHRFLFAAATILALGVAGTAEAQTLFGFLPRQASTFPRPVSYDVDAGTAFLSTDTDGVLATSLATADPVPVLFQFSAPNSAGMDLFTDATATLFATSAGMVNADGEQPFDGTIRFESPSVAGGVLATVTFENAFFDASTRQTGTLGGDDEPPPPGQDVTINSPFLPSTFENTFAIALDNFMPELSPFPINSGNYNEFDAQHSGIFSGIIPEPASVAMFSVGVLGLPVALAIRRRRARA